MMPCSQSKRGAVNLAVLCFLVMFAIAALAISWPLINAQPQNGEGTIELSDLALDIGEDRMELAVSARVRLSPTVEDGLNSGVPLTFLLNLDIVHPRALLWDKTVMALQRRYTLTYYELTRHYRVSAVESDASRNFRSLSSALQGLGQMVNISAEIDANRNAWLDGEGLQASVSMQLSKSALPLPLQPIIRSSWTMVSREYRWPIT